VLQLEFGEDRRLSAARLIPMRQRPAQGPFPDPDRSALELLRSLSREDFGANAAEIAQSGEITPPAGSP
jgi:hypothetical protein